MKKLLRSTYWKAKSNFTHLLLELNGSRDYVRFVILGRSRVGSNFLRGLLNSHSQIVTFGEIFSVKSQPPNALSSKHKDPQLFLEEEVFGKYPKDIAAVGFKIFYYHARSGSQQAIWSYLQSQKELRVIHIKRANILKTYLSRKRAGSTEKWINSNGNTENEAPIYLNYEECLAEFNSTREWEMEADGYFESHRKLDLLYEDLANNYENEMERIQTFLRVEFENVEPTTHKQSHRPLSESISNYSELKEKFGGTPWAGLFED